MIFTKKVKTPSCYFGKNHNTPLSFTLKKWLPRCILHRPRYKVNFSSPLTDGCRAVIGGKSIRTVEGFLICFRDNDPVAITLLTAKIRCSLTELPTLLLGKFECLEIAANNKERLRPSYLS